MTPLKKLKEVIKINFNPMITKRKFVINNVIALLIILILLNTYGLIPYLFSITTQPRFNFFISFRIVIALIIQIIWNKEASLIHLVPKSAPTPLIVPLVLIETIRTLIKPLTLGLRLTANIIAGHLILTLVGSIIIALPVRAPITSLFITALRILETIVATIQRYVIAILVALYIKDRAENDLIFKQAKYTKTRKDFKNYNEWKAYQEILNKEKEEKERKKKRLNIKNLPYQTDYW